MINKTRAAFLADWAANDCLKHDFGSRRGVFHLEDADCLVVYNNYPYQVDPSIRPKEMDEYERLLDEVGITVLGRGEAGPFVDEKSQRYTATLLLDCSSDRMQEVLWIGEEVYRLGSAIADVAWRARGGKN